MKNYYECHVTIDPKYAEIVEPIAKKHKFKTSVLKGDEVMGDDKLLYCTTHDSALFRIDDRMEKLIKHLNVPILRKKIEYIILDVRY